MGAATASRQTAEVFTHRQKTVRACWLMICQYGHRKNVCTAVESMDLEMIQDLFVCNAMWLCVKNLVCF